MSEQLKEAYKGKLVVAKDRGLRHDWTSSQTAQNRNCGELLTVDPVTPHAGWHGILACKSTQSSRS
jgi:hypothetical protein